jgi:two-component system, OmpR family, response regulator
VNAVVQQGRQVLVVDDEPSIVDAVSTALADAGYRPLTAGNGGKARAVLADTPGISLVVLDVMLPGQSGFEIADQFRRDGIAIPVLFLTARDSIGDKVRGLRAGDDYLTKPFDVVELVARVDVILRRTSPVDLNEVLRCADVILDVDAHTVTRAGQPLRLTATEFRLLEYLMENADRVLSKQQILDEVWGYSFEGDDGVVETYVRYLRRKLDTYGTPLIETVRLVGYVFRTRAEHRI